jgi:two-component system sensor histidine kinase DesK
MDEAIGDPGPAGAPRTPEATPAATRFRPGLRAGYESRGARVASIFFTGIWLLYLIGPVVDLFTQHHSAAYTWVGFSIILVFAAIYIVLVPRWVAPPRYSLQGLAALFALAVAACVLYGGSGSTALWIFVASASGLLVTDSRWALRVVGGCIAAYVLFSFTGHVPTSDFLGDLLPAVFVGLGMIGLRRQFQLTHELSQAREEVAQLAANEERLRLARDMHDLTGQSLSMITLKSELAARLLSRIPEGPDRDRARDEIEQVAAVSRQTLHDIREAISGYRRPTLAVEIITARAALTSAGITAVDDAALTLLSGTFDPDAEAALAWCLREAVTNVVRHSSARTCHLGLAGRPGSMILTVRDDGQGHVPAAGQEPCPGGPFTPPQGTPRVRSGTGLRGMSERLSAVGGSLELRPDLSPGFALIATIPVGAPAAPGGLNSFTPLGRGIIEAATGRDRTRVPRGAGEAPGTDRLDEARR